MKKIDSTESEQSGEKSASSTPTSHHAQTAAKSPELLRLITRVASMYYERGLGQVKIARQLGLSQARVSRLLKQAESHGIVKITVHAPPGIHTDVEKQLEQIYELDQIVVVETENLPSIDDDMYHQALAASAASCLEVIIPTVESVGIVASSPALLAAVNSMRTPNVGRTGQIIQVIGEPDVDDTRTANRVTERLAQLTRSEAVYLRTPGVVADPDARNALLRDQSCEKVVAKFDSLDALLVGIGGLPPFRTPQECGYVFSDEDVEMFHSSGAVGAVCLRYYDAHGNHLKTGFDQRVLGIDTAQIRNTRRRIGVAGGPKKFEAIRGALRGGWLSTLVTDLQTAEQLLETP